MRQGINYPLHPHTYTAPSLHHSQRVDRYMLLLSCSVSWQLCFALQGTGSDEEMGIEERQQLATEGIVVAAVDVVRGPMAMPSAQDTVDAFTSLSGQPLGLSRPSSLKAQIRVTTRAMWIDNGRLLEILHKVGA